MCFSTEMKDLLPKEKPLVDDDLSWWLEELLLTYQYNYKEKYFQALSMLKPYLSDRVIRILTEIGEYRHFWGKEK